MLSLQIMPLDPVFKKESIASLAIKCHIKDLSSLHKLILELEHHPSHQPLQPINQDFNNKLVQTSHQTHKLKVFLIFSAPFLGINIKT